MQKKSILSDIEILERLPLKLDSLLLFDQFGHYSNPRKKISDLAKKGYFELLYNGHYLNLKSRERGDTSPERLANAIYFPSYVSLEWALQYYGLLTDRVYTITSVTSRKKAYFKTPLGNFSYEHLHSHRYPCGYELEPKLKFLIARPEKALLDYLKLREHEMRWPTPQAMEEFFFSDLRLKYQSLLQQTSAENIRELLPHYHRNSPEAWILRQMLWRKEKNG